MTDLTLRRMDLTTKTTSLTLRSMDLTTKTMSLIPEFWCARVMSPSTNPGV